MPMCSVIYMESAKNSKYDIPSFKLTTTIPESVEHSLGCVQGRGRISRSGLTRDIKMGSCVFQCDVAHQWTAQ